MQLSSHVQYSTPAPDTCRFQSFDALRSFGRWKSWIVSLDIAHDPPPTLSSPITRARARTHTHTTSGVAENSHLRKSNYFYYNCLTGRFLRDNCPNYLKELQFSALKDGAIDGLSVVTGTFLGELRARKFTKVLGGVGWCAVSHWVRMHCGIGGMSFSSSSSYTSSSGRPVGCMSIH